MLNSVYTTIFTEESGEIDIQIVAEHRTNIVDFNSAEVYSIWNSGDEPLGLFTRSADNLVYEGSELSEEEYQQVLVFIQSYREGDWDI